MPDILYPLSRRLLDLEVAARPLRSEKVPDAVVVQRFQDDAVGVVDGYLQDLEDAFSAAEIDSTIIVVDVLAARPSALKPPWQRPREWLDYIPDSLERGDVQPHVRPPQAPRPDWTAVVEPPSCVAPEAFQEPPAPVPESERTAALRRSLERWQRSGGALADLDLPEASHDQVRSPEATALLPLPEATTLRLGGGRRALGPELPGAGAAGPLGGGA